MPASKTYTIRELADKANEIRKDIISMLLEAGSGHTAGPLGMADVFTALYFAVLNYDPKKPDWPDRDRLVFAKDVIALFVQSPGQGHTHGLGDALTQWA